MEFGSGSRILAQFGSGSTVVINFKEKNYKKFLEKNNFLKKEKRIFFIKLAGSTKLLNTDPDPQHWFDFSLFSSFTVTF